MKALEDEDADIRRLTAFVLGRIAEKAKPALPALAGRLSDPDYSVREPRISLEEGLGRTYVWIEEQVRRSLLAHASSSGS